MALIEIIRALLCSTIRAFEKELFGTALIQSKFNHFDVALTPKGLDLGLRDCVESKSDFRKQPFFTADYSSQFQKSLERKVTTLIRKRNSDLLAQKIRE